jgi:hypothetical protein
VGRRRAGRCWTGLAAGAAVGAVENGVAARAVLDRGWWRPGRRPGRLLTVAEVALLTGSACRQQAPRRRSENLWVWGDYFSSACPDRRKLYFFRRLFFKTDVS